MMENKLEIHKETFIADSVDLIGDISIGKGSSIWFGTVIRGDYNSIKIGQNTNIQDNSVLHVGQTPLNIGNNVTIGHNAIVHGCQVEDNVLIGMGAIILDGVKIGKNSIIGAGALVTGNKIIPENSLVMGVPGKVVRTLSEEEIDSIKSNAESYVNLWKKKYKK